MIVFYVSLYVQDFKSPGGLKQFSWTLQNSQRRCWWVQILTCRHQAKPNDSANASTNKMAELRSKKTRLDASREQKSIERIQEDIHLGHKTGEGW